MKQVGKMLSKLIQSAYKCKNHHIFIDYSPHVESVYIRVYLHGWDEYKECDETHIIYLDKEDTKERLKAMIGYINHLGGE